MTRYQDRYIVHMRMEMKYYCLYYQFHRTVLLEALSKLSDEVDAMAEGMFEGSGGPGDSDIMELEVLTSLTDDLTGEIADTIAELAICMDGYYGFDPHDAELGLTHHMEDC